MKGTNGPGFNEGGMQPPRRSTRPGEWIGAGPVGVMLRHGAKAQNRKSSSVLHKGETKIGQLGRNALSSLLAQTRRHQTSEPERSDGEWPFGLPLAIP